MSEEATQDTGSQEVAEPVSFLDSLPEDIRGEPSLKNITDAAQLAKGFVHAQRMVGADKIAKPQASWTDEQYSHFYADIGRPESADKYELDMDKEVFKDSNLDGFRQHAFDAGLTAKQAQNMVNFLESSLTGMQKSFEDRGETLRHESEQQLRQEFGKAFDQKVELASKAAAKYMSNDLMDEVQLADGRLLGDHPEIVKLFANIAADIGEDSLEGAPTELVMTPQEAQQKINEMTRLDGPYHDARHPQHDAYVQEVTRLYEHLT